MKKLLLSAVLLTSFFDVFSQVPVIVYKSYSVNSISVVIDTIAKVKSDVTIYATVQGDINNIIPMLNYRMLSTSPATFTAIQIDSNVIYTCKAYIAKINQ